MHDVIPSVCPRCGRINEEGRQFCVGCAEFFVPPDEMNELERAEWFTALRNWYLLYLDPMGEEEGELCSHCKAQRKPRDLFCGNCGAVFRKLLDLSPPDAAYPAMWSARIARLRHLDQQSRPLTDYGVRDFTDAEDVRGGIDRKVKLILNTLEDMKQAALAELKQRQALERARDEVVRVIREAQIEATGYAARHVQKRMYYGLPLAFPDIPGSGWSQLSDKQKEEMRETHGMIQAWWNCAWFFGMAWFGFSAPFVVSFGKTAGYSIVQAIVGSLLLSVVAMMALSAFFLSYFFPRLVFPMSRISIWLVPVSLLAGLALSWLKDLDLVAMLVATVVWFVLSWPLWLGIRELIWGVRAVIIERSEPKSVQNKG